MFINETKIMSNNPNESYTEREAMHKPSRYVLILQTLLTKKTQFL